MTTRQTAILAALAAVLAVVLMLSGCTSPQPVKPLAVDALPMPPGWTQPKTVTKSLAPAAPAMTITNRVRLSWYQPGAASGWVIEESVDQRNWTQVARITNGGSNVRRTNIFTTINNPAYWRVGAFNQ
jgi:hypothetical protein